MLDFNKYLMRYGEHGVQEIIENIEKNEGLRHNRDIPLEVRWNTVMQEPARKAA